MAWFKRQTVGIKTGTDDRNEVPDGYWQNCPSCAEIVSLRVLIQELYVCPQCGFHHKMGSQGYFKLLFDGGAYTCYDEALKPVDALSFVDSKSYQSRLVAAQKKTGLSDAIRSAVGKIGGRDVSVACMDFSFIGGSMGSVVGEVIARTIRRGLERKIPVMVISQSGGARMMEGALSLMQMAKTSALLALLHEARLPYFSLMTDPTTGGVTASFAMLGDFNLAEPGALIGFAGPRVIRESIGQDLPDGFQKSEFLLEKGFLDDIVDRRNLRNYLIHMLDLLYDDDDTDRET